MSKASSFFQLSLCTIGCLYATSNTTLAQVTSDGTVNTQVTENGKVSEITGGQTRGSNLFHSFRDFSVGTGNEAFFNNADSISNIFSRITGGSVSNIDGLIRANGSASLFLINPAGIIFGEGARLDIGGSFYGSSASSILFEDGEFSATDLENPPVLTVNAPIGLGFRDEPGDIVNRSVGENPNGETNVTGGAVGLQVPNGETLAIVGGNVLFDDGNLTAKGGHIEIGSVRGAGEIGFTEIDTKFVLNYDSINSFGDITLQNTAVVDVNSSNGGSINVNGNNLTISNSSLNSGIALGLGTPDSQAGDIKIDTSLLSIIDGGSISTSISGQGNGGKILINADNSVSLGNQEGKGNLFSDVNSDAVGNSGGIEINTGSLTVKNASQITSQVVGKGNSGDININAQGQVSFDGRDETDTLPSAIFTSIEPNGEGDGGNININAGSLELTNRAQLLSNVEGIGNAGDINIQVENETNLVNSALISEISAPDENSEGGRGSGGDINITTGSLFVRDGSAFLADTENIGDAGNINIEARESVVLEGEGQSVFANSSDIVFSQISTTAESNASGKSGNIDISASELSIDEGFITSSTFNAGNAGNTKVSANNLFLTNGGQISSFTSNAGNASNITLNISNTILLDGEDRNGFKSGLFASVAENATGNGGNINLGSEQSPIGQLSLTNGGTIDVGTFGEGNAGNLTINTGNLTVKNTNISTSTGSEGNAGNLTVNASESIELSGEFLDENGNPTGPGGLLAQADLNSTGKGGNLTVETKRLSISNGSKIQAATFNNGDAGEIEIRASEIDIFNTPGVTTTYPTEINAGSVRDKTGANANSPLKGNGGSIKIETDQLNIRNEAGIRVSSEGQGKSGDLNIQTENLDLSARAQLLAEAASGEGGNINLKIDDTLTMRNNSLISAQALNNANGGNVNIDTNFIVAFPNQINGNGSDIIASAAEGDGGRITINAESLLGIKERKAEGNNQTNDIDASSKFGLDGTVSIFTPDINPVQGAAELPSNVVEPEKTTTQTCQANRDGTAKNGLTIKGKGGVPPAPDLPLNSQNISINGEIDPTISTIPEPIETSLGKIQPARGIKVTKDGRVILTAYRTNNAGERIPEIKPNCR